MARTTALTEENRATVIANMHRKIGKDNAYASSGDMLADRQTDRQTDRHTDTYTDVLITILRHHSRV